MEYKDARPINIIVRLYKIDRTQNIACTQVLRPANISQKNPVPLYVCYMISGCPCFPGTVTTTNVSGTRYGNKVSLVLADDKSHKVEI